MLLPPGNPRPSKTLAIGGFLGVFHQFGGGKNGGLPHWLDYRFGAGGARALKKFGERGPKNFFWLRQDDMSHPFGGDVIVSLFLGEIQMAIQPPLKL